MKQNINNLLARVAKLNANTDNASTNPSSANPANPAIIPATTKDLTTSVYPLQLQSLNESKRIIALVENQKPRAIEITISYIINGIIVKKRVDNLRDFVYLYLDLVYNNNIVLNINLSINEG